MRLPRIVFHEFARVNVACYCRLFRITGDSRDVEHAVWLGVKLRLVLVHEVDELLIEFAVSDGAAEENDVVAIEVDAFAFGLHHVHHGRLVPLCFNDFADPARDAGGASVMAPVDNQHIFHA